MKEKIKKLKELLVNKEFIKFCIVGSSYTLVAVFVYWFFSDTLGIKAVIVTLVWVPSSFIMRFVINKLWVFKKK